VATAVALDALAGTPFAEAARSALCKIFSVMTRSDIAAAHDLAGRIHLAAPEPGEEPAAASVLRAAEEAVIRRVVLAIEYVDRNGAASRRSVEPLGLRGAGSQWYLVGWCRLRGELREFRLDRMRTAAPTAEIAPVRPVDAAAVALLDARAPYRLELLDGASAKVVEQPGQGAVRLPGDDGFSSWHDLSG
jgi:predicted DNA-binding transcriptional regulator YafY